MSKGKKRIIFHKGFTLAEVLVTLGIIGVVAALTIPALNNAIQDKENKAAFKKAYTTIMGTVRQATYDNGGSIAGQFTDATTMKNFFEPYFKTVKSCNNGDGSCWTCNWQRPDDYFFNGKSVTTTSGMGWWYRNNSAFVLSDGTIVDFWFASNSCQGNDNGTIAPYINSLCGAVNVDVNGCKAPNTWGRDIFPIYILKDNAVPAGPLNNNDASRNCINSAAKTLAGMHCAEYVIQNKDY